MSRGQMPPVKVVVSEEKEVLRRLLERNGVLEEVETGKSIILYEGKSLVDLTFIVPSGKQLAIVSFEALGGG